MTSAEQKRIYLLEKLESGLTVIKQQMNIQTMQKLYDERQAALEYYRHLPNEDFVGGENEID